MGVRERLPDESAAARAQESGGGRLRDGMHAARSFVALVSGIVTLERRMERFQARLERVLGSERPDLSGWRSDELVAYYRSLEGRILTHWDAPIVNDFATMIFHGVLRRLTSAWAGDDDGSLANDLLGADRGMISEEPARRVSAMARLAAGDGELVAAFCDGEPTAMRAALSRCPELECEVQGYLARFGDRCLEELKLESPTLHEDPSPLLRAIGQRARCLGGLPQGETDGAERGCRELAEARMRRALRGSPVKRIVFARVLRRTRQCVRARENLRFERTRVFGRARQILLELGKRFAALDCIDTPRDIFYLELDEVLGFVEGRVTTTDLRGMVVVRRAEFERWRDLPPPADQFETRGIPYCGHALAAERTVSSPAGETLRGLGCCAGVVRGPVRLVLEPRSAVVHAGEIIVAERTDPGWVMIFPAASGLLVERGSLLSHSAIVARELGLPTIVSLSGVTAWLRDGDWVEMDGGSGVVAKVPGPGKAQGDGGT